ncbi:phage minor head protein [uncultured Sphingomonas sp.]|uniref:phage minor head protein n=1 Tax=uncultured Sphingomonas sp. TaxID=158754 RepID=UPI0025E958F1|nr:phage minor head protein [uncultured Sphingomonas sp.]
MIVDDQREAIRAVIEAGIEAGRGPRDTALDIIGRVDKAAGKRTGGIVGLNAPQAKARVKAGTELDELDPAYFERKLRDKRFDPMVKKAIEEGKPLSKADRERILTRYSDRLLKYRGDMIARTETIASLNAGRNEGIQQLIDAGRITENQVVKIWDSTGADGRTRDTHLGMEDQRKRLGEPFISPSGARMMHPGDTSLQAPGSETINCRCVLRFDIDFYRGLK